MLNVPEASNVKMNSYTAMRKYLLVFVAVMFTFSGFAQKTADIGVWGGASSYWGDMTEVNYGESLNPMFGAYFRYNFNPRYSLRAMYLTGHIGAKGFMENSGWEYYKATHDLSLLMEINFLKYILGFKKTPITSYLLAGLGVMYYPYILDPAAIHQFNPMHNKGNIELSQSVVAATFPFGMGVKMNLGKRLGIGLEVLFRKLFDDRLDNLDDPLAYSAGSGKEVFYTDSWHNNDYAVFMGLHLTYKIYLGKQVCPVYDSKIKN
ncbi:hypothetical protein MNBD_BACTEROID01-63 [hydrothermal vent metagenome]|uniref:DUF6089 domain-containing protein n=1 Tax=hydrothermal vent metagenome TaxID=652676 RepID=A0A3B0U4K4_9ZZZZ